MCATDELLTVNFFTNNPALYQLWTFVWVSDVWKHSRQKIKNGCGYILKSHAEFQSFTYRYVFISLPEPLTRGSAPGSTGCTAPEPPLWQQVHLLQSTVAVCSMPNYWSIRNQRHRFMAGWHWQKFWPNLPLLFKTQKTGQLILGKIIKIVATRCQILRLNYTNAISSRAPPKILLGELTALPPTF